MPTSATAATPVDKQLTGDGPNNPQRHLNLQHRAVHTASTPSTNAVPATSDSSASSGAPTANDPPDGSDQAAPAPTAETPSPSSTSSRRLCPNLSKPDHVVTASHTTTVDSTIARGVLASPELSLSIPFALPSFALASVRPPLSYKNSSDSADDRAK